MEKALGNQQRKIHVLVARSFETVIQFTLQQLPHGVAVGFDDHAAFHDLRWLSHIALENNVLIPSRKVLIACRDRRFGHCGKTLSILEVNRSFANVEISRPLKLDKASG